MKDDLTLFGMNFRSSSLYALSPLFTAVSSLRKPMFCFEITMETKELENDKGKWLIPVVRVGEPVASVDIFSELYTMAKRFDHSGHAIVENMNTKEEEPAPVKATGDEIPF